MDIKTKKMVVSLLESLCKTHPNEIKRTEVPITGGFKVTYWGQQGIKLEHRFRDGKGCELFARGKVLDDLGLKYYASSGAAGKPENIDQCVEILRRMITR